MAAQVIEHSGRAAQPLQPKAVVALALGNGIAVRCPLVSKSKAVDQFLHPLLYFYFALSRHSPAV